MTIERTGNTLKEILLGWAHLAWPDLCHLCGRPLQGGEHLLCLNCLFGLPVLSEPNFLDNRTAARFLGKLHFERAASAFRYEKDSDLQHIVEEFKYKGEFKLAEKMGALAAGRLVSQGFFEGVDGLVPVPLHPRKQRVRGYNQSEHLAIGLSKVCGIPVWPDILARTRNNSSQTTRNVWRRWENAMDLFCLGKTTDREGCHLLLVDDVLTSGSTLEACGKVLLEIPETSVSFFALALA